MERPPGRGLGECQIVSYEPTVPQHKPYIYHSHLCGVEPMFVLWREQEAEYYRQYGGAPEAALIEWASQFCVNKGVFLDIGANVGTYAITYALLGQTVIAWEPHPRIFKYLNAGCILNEARVEIHRVALGAESGVARLQVEKGWPDGGGGSLVRRFDDPGESYTVNVTRLDDWALSPTFIKIDVEGAELDVLRGARDTIDIWKPRIMFECWSEEKGQRTESLFKYLRDELNYQTRECGWPDTWIAIPR